jgi:hypothetical protein
VRYSTFAALCALTAIVAACGGAPADVADPADDADPVAAEPAAPAGDDFLAAVEARCEQANEEIAAAEEAFPEETPEAAAGYFEAFADAVDGFADDVAAMEPPAELEEGTEETLAHLRATTSAMREASAEFAAGNDDFEAVTADVWGNIGQAEGAATQTFGFPLSSCGEEVQQAEADAQQVAVTATDYEFSFDEVPTGRVAFTMDNQGEEPHFMYIVKLVEGVTLAEVLEAEQAGEDPDRYVEEEIGDSATVGPGQTAAINADITPGTYGMLCFVSAPDGAPHAALGMAEEFTVGG